MALRWLTYYSAREASDEAVRLVAELRAAGERPVLIVPSYDETVRWKHMLAARGVGFGVAVTTFDAWVADLWELFGDGREQVSSLQREVLMRKALQVAAGEQIASSVAGGGTIPSDGALPCGDDVCGGMESRGAGVPEIDCTPGYARVLARAAKEGFAAAVDVLRSVRGDDEPAISGAQMLATQIVGRYGDLLAERNLVETTQVYAELIAAGAVEDATVVVVDTALTELQIRFLETAQTTGLEVLWETEGSPGRPEELARLQRSLLAPDFDNPLKPQGHVRFVLPSGKYAAGQAIAGELLAWFEEHPQAKAALAAPQPSAWFSEIAPRLSQGGVSCALSGACSFGETAFGRVWCALLRFAAQGEDGVVDAHLAGDYALSLFSAIPGPAARICDSRFRGSRAQTVDDALTDLTAFARDDSRDIMAAFAEGRYLEALWAERQWVMQQRSWPQALRDESLSAIACAVRVHAAAEEAGLSLEDMIEVLEAQVVGVSKCMPAQAPSHAEPSAGDRGQLECSGRPGQLAETPSASGAHVDFLSLAQLAACPTSSYDAVVLTDLTAIDYPLSDESDATDTLLNCWGVGSGAREARGLFRTGTQQMQKRYVAALAAARECVVLSRPLNDVDGDEQRPSALFEETVDCYRHDPQNADEVSKVTGLTADLGAYARCLGEEGIVENLSGAPVLLERHIPLYPTGAVSEEARGRILLPRVFAKGEIRTEPYLSPSAIESYLECPHLWFARRRLRLDVVDADFGGFAFGNFAHGVLEQLHATLRERGMRRVTEQNVEAAVGLMNAVFDERFAYEQHRFAKDALIPQNELERLEVEQLRRKIEALVRREALLLPDFAPRYEEFPFGEGGDEFVYAGVHVAGKVDRIDVDAFGRAVVIDYKGSVGREYAFRTAADDPVVLPRKMQTLIYAQMVRRKLGLVPVGAIYLSYGKDGQVRGLFDRTVLDGDADLLGIDPDTCGTADFEGALDAAEAEVEQRIAQLLAGEIPPAAVDLKACEYCPVGLCERRDALLAEMRGGAE